MICSPNKRKTGSIPVVERLNLFLLVQADTSAVQAQATPDQPISPEDVQTHIDEVDEVPLPALRRPVTDPMQLRQFEECQPADSLWYRQPLHSSSETTYPYTVVATAQLKSMQVEMDLLCRRAQSLAPRRRVAVVDCEVDTGLPVSGNVAEAMTAPSVVQVTVGHSAQMSALTFTNSATVLSMAATAFLLDYMHELVGR